MSAAPSVPLPDCGAGSDINTANGARRMADIRPASSREYVLVSGPPDVALAGNARGIRSSLQLPRQIDDIRPLVLRMAP